MLHFLSFSLSATLSGTDSDGRMDVRADCVIGGLDVLCDIYAASPPPPLYICRVLSVCSKHTTLYYNPSLIFILMED